jgi:hypothetical protein
MRPRTSRCLPTWLSGRSAPAAQPRHMLTPEHAKEFHVHSDVLDITTDTPLASARAYLADWWGARGVGDQLAI